MNKLDQISWYGAYGVLLNDSQMLLTQKKSGPYYKLWGLPGGRIEFGETPENTLTRELKEETTLIVDKVELLTVTTSTGVYTKDGTPYEFHHVGLIYKVLSWTQGVNMVPEEKLRWVNLHDINLKELTPFAQHVLTHIQTQLSS